MNTLQQRFLRLFYEKLLYIINDPMEIKKALDGFRGSDLSEGNQRYICRESFGLEQWDETSAEEFSAAVSEALAKTTLSISTESTATGYKQQTRSVIEEARLSSLQQISETIKNKQIPELTAEVTLPNPLESMALLIQARIESLPPTQVRFELPGTIFQPPPPSEEPLSPERTPDRLSDSEDERIRKVESNRDSSSILGSFGFFGAAAVVAVGALAVAAVYSSRPSQ